MTTWQNERWACAPENDGKNFAPAHRWAVVAARPWCYAVKGGHDFKNKHGYPCYSCVYYRDNRMPNYAFKKRWISFEYCEQNDLIDEDDEFESWNGDCVYARAHERIADYRYTQAALRAYIREAHELRHRIKVREWLLKSRHVMGDAFDRMRHRKMQILLDRVATLEAENAALREARGDA